MATTIEEFPAAAKQYLQSFYEATGFAKSNAKKKIEVLRKANELEDTILTSDEGLQDDAAELRALEFFVLTRQGIL
jgi:ABC-type nitrate/sulfonate/bicarbonate transport system substrate-binding protein